MDNKGSGLYIDTHLRFVYPTYYAKHFCLSVKNMLELYVLKNKNMTPNIDIAK